VLNEKISENYRNIQLKTQKMYIKEIIVEGFKSYAQTTVISPFDPHFNAITGLNGSGKSNILDSICFLLGISNLSQVRATNLQELIYKGGNAGITKATVSITFDNLDKAQSPPGYHEYEEITITRQISTGGKHKYLINGQNATAQRVSDLFCSVQLNVNNPNFLIMQGKITKVLNMKPIEILSMIEEAAGTKTYDMKKANSLQTIDKKNAKLNEIERVLREDITPMIEKLKQERSSYIEYQKCEREYLHLHKISIAHNYYENDEMLRKIQTDSSEIDKEHERHMSRISEIDDLMRKLREEIEQMKENMSARDDGLVELESKLKEHQIELTKLKAELKIAESSMKSENKKLADIEKSINENKSGIDIKQSKLNDMRVKFESSRAVCDTAEANLKHAQREYEALCCGFVVGDDENQLETAEDQLLKIRGKITEKQTAIKKAQIKIKSSKDECEKLDKQVKSDAKVYEEKKREFELKQSAHDKVQGELDSLNFNESNLSELTMTRRDINAKAFNLKESMQGFYSKFPQLNFDYKDPQPGFDRSKVKGLVCNLFKIKDLRFATALEVAAGGKLYNLVVDSDQTGKLILQRGELKRKTTIIPMNQIRAHAVSAQVIKAAKNLVGEENVYSALSLIDYDPQYKQVMEFVFGNRLVCFNLDAAKKVAFHPQVMTSTITLDGDHFDPEGVLTGGARGERAQILMNLTKFNEQQEELNRLQAELNRIDAEIGRMREVADVYAKKKAELNKRLNELNLAKINVEQTSHHQTLEKIQSLHAQIEELKAAIETDTNELAKLNEKQIEMEEKVNNKSNGDAEKRKAEKKIEEAKKALESEQKSSNKLQQEFKTLELEIEVLNKEVKTYEEEIGKINGNIEGLNTKSTQIKQELEQIQAQEAETSNELDKKRQIIYEKNRAVDAKSKECDNLEKEKNKLDLKLKELAHKKSNIGEQIEHAEHRLESLLRAHEWINDEREMFGKANTIYDFKRQNMKELHHRLNEIKTRKEKLSKNVDVRAMGMLAKKEEEYEELNKKRLIVLKDKSTLESTIEDLEKVKTEVLLKAFESINKDLGNIFKTLLPGAFAKLELVNKNSLLDGVEFKVAFGDVWKESLTELSGGQRSLVALSLILSLLLYKPAPLYILDEVDAALDTSHTQNIGLMIKKYFKHSQFIIVSLKDNMFNNANVLFRTKLIDGISTIQRYEQRKKVTNEKEISFHQMNQSNARRV
jgi:structural maintenance of chromosome 2